MGDDFSTMHNIERGIGALVATVRENEQTKALGKKASEYHIKMEEHKIQENGCSQTQHSTWPHQHIHPVEEKTSLRYHQATNTCRRRGMCIFPDSSDSHPLPPIPHAKSRV